MKMLVAILALFSMQSSFAQPAQFQKEEFINAILDKVIDSSLSRFYLLSNAYPCSFKRYDYDEWMKYGLETPVTIDVMNELARKSYYDTAINTWTQSRLNKAICIDDKQAKRILDAASIPDQTSQTSKKVARKEWKSWQERPSQEKLVLFF